jgi:hypothetical protein
MRRKKERMVHPHREGGKLLEVIMKLEKVLQGE